MAKNIEEQIEELLDKRQKFDVPTRPEFMTLMTIVIAISFVLFLIVVQLLTTYWTQQHQSYQSLINEIHRLNE